MNLSTHHHHQSSTQSLSCSKHTISTANSSIGTDLCIYGAEETTAGTESDRSYICHNSHSLSGTTSSSEEADFHHHVPLNHKLEEGSSASATGEGLNGDCGTLIPDSIQLNNDTFRNAAITAAAPPPTKICQLQEHEHKYLSHIKCKQTKIVLGNGNGSNHSSVAFQTPHTYLELPVQSQEQFEMNEFLLQHPILYENAKNQLLQNKVHYLSESSLQILFPKGRTGEQQRQGMSLQKWNEGPSERPIVYVHQREVAHVSNEQYNHNGAILVSDNATTCHVIALRSYPTATVTTTNDCSQPSWKKPRTLGSLCHLDSTSYTSCLESMIQTHLQYHETCNDAIVVANDSDKLPKNVYTRRQQQQQQHITMEIHMIGGYNDSNNTSAELSSHVLEFSDKLSTQYSSVMDCTLKTCIISSLNDMTSYENSVLLSSSLSSLKNYNVERNSPKRKQREQYRRKLSLSSSTSSLSSYNSCTMQDTAIHNTTCVENQGRYMTTTSNLSRKMPSPIIRGLAMDVSTGKVQLIRKVDSSLWGPEPTLRRSRLWCPPDDDDDNDDENINIVTPNSIPPSGSTSSTNTTEIIPIKHNLKSLLQIHTYTKDEICIPPFEFKAFEFIDVFYKLPDDVMLSMGSTSPGVEDDDFCPLVRETCFFLMTTKYESVFPLRKKYKLFNKQNQKKVVENVQMQRAGLSFSFDGEDWWQCM